MAADSLLLNDLEAAALVGVSRATWHRLRAAGKLPRAVRLGRCVRWSRSELVSWISAGCPSQEIFDEIRVQSRRRGTS